MQNLHSTGKRKITSAHLVEELVTSVHLAEGFVTCTHLFEEEVAIVHFAEEIVNCTRLLYLQYCTYGNYQPALGRGMVTSGHLVEE